MKAIMMSIRPEWVAKILNGEKTIEIRKKFPSDYVGWVYIYCTKAHNVKDFETRTFFNGNHIEMQTLNGKVIARFWCDKVEEINKIIMYNRPFDLFETETLQPSELLKQSCLRAKEMTKYFMFSNLPKESAAIHITKLEIFDKPKEINEFYGAFAQKRYERIFGNNAIELDEKYGGLRQPTESGYEYTYPLTRAPQSYCFIEV